MATKQILLAYQDAKLSVKYIQEIANHIGIADLPDSAADVLVEDISWRLIHIIQESVKFMRHAKRTKLSRKDVICATIVVKEEHHFDFEFMDYLPFLLHAKGSKETTNKKVILVHQWLDASSNNQVQKSYTAEKHVVAGVEDYNLKLENKLFDTIEIEYDGSPKYVNFKMKILETVQIKQFDTHELSAEQQYYYMALTEACVGPDETRRNEALRTLAVDQSICQYMPALTVFIFDGVRVNVVQCNLTLSIYFMRMVRSLMDNPAVHIHKYLHKLLPSAVTCVVTRSLCLRPELENHWALRDFASRLIFDICKRYNSFTNGIQLRVTKLFLYTVRNSHKIPLFSLYGSLVGLAEFGTLAIRQFILPHIKLIGKRLECHLEGASSSNEDILGAMQVKDFLVKILTPIIKSIRKPPDNLDDYNKDYGFLGNELINAVVPKRSTPLNYIHVE